MASDQVLCCFKNVSLYPDGSRILARNLNIMLKSDLFNGLNQLESDKGKYEITCSQQTAVFIRSNLAAILTSQYRSIWFSYAPILNSFADDSSKRYSNRNASQGYPWKVSCNFGSMLSYDTFQSHYDDSHPFCIHIQRDQRKIPSFLSLTNVSSGIQMKVYFSSIQYDILIKLENGEQDDRVSIILMLNHPPKIYMKNNDRSYSRIASMPSSNNLVKMVGLSSDVHIQFQSRSDAWAFLKQIPNKKDPLKFQLNFAEFQVLLASQRKKSSSIFECENFPSSLGYYGFQILMSLGHLFQEKCKNDVDFQRQFINYHKASNRCFYDFCCTLWSRLKTDHCCPIVKILEQHQASSSNAGRSLRKNMYEIPLVIVTPLRILFHPMHTTEGHRALRQLNQNNQYQWMLVHFREEDEQQQVMTVMEETQLMQRYKCILEKGITFQCYPYGHLMHYRFGSSGSQIKKAEHWFLGPTQVMNMSPKQKVAEIINSLGDLKKIRNVATYVARIGLYLTTSKPTGIKFEYIGPSCEVDGSISAWSTLTFKVKRFFRTPEEKYKAYLIDDIERNGYCFTDGVGKMGLGLAKEIARSIGIKISRLEDIPSAYQVRIAGCKGMLSIDPASKWTDYNIYIRKSMNKFVSDDWTLEIVNHSQPMCLSLNNQIIRLLYDLNRANQAVIESLQNRCALEGMWHPPEENYLNVFDTRKFDLIKDENRRKGYCNAKDLLMKNKIPLPVDEARLLFGIADETGLLKEGQCFIQYQSMDKKTYKVVEGDILVTKNPCLYPGDIRCLKAVKIRTLCESIRDCIVFPVDGRRPHFNEISGSDLDGDQYWVYWGTELTVTKIETPLDYVSAKKIEVAEVNESYVNEHILRTMGDSLVGLICNTHSVIADKHPNGTFSPECIELAKLFPRVIDSIKTGEIVSTEGIFELQKKYCDTYPSWMHKVDKEISDSQSINGQLAQRARTIRIPDKLYSYVLHKYPRVDNTLDRVIPIECDEQNEESGLFRKIINLLYFGYFTALLIINFFYFIPLFTII